MVLLHVNIELSTCVCAKKERKGGRRLALNYIRLRTATPIHTHTHHVLRSKNTDLWVTLVYIYNLAKLLTFIAIQRI